MGTASSVSITMLGFLAPCLLLLAALAEGRPQEEWATYKATYGKEYSEAEDLVRYSRWLYNKEVVDTHNSGDHSYKMALMEYSDWTEEEMSVPGRLPHLHRCPRRLQLPALPPWNLQRPELPVWTAEPRSPAGRIQ